MDTIEFMKSDLVKMLFDNNYIDYPFNETVFNHMDVLLSPLNTPEDNERVKSIIEKYTGLTEFTLKQSNMKIRK